MTKNFPLCPSFGLSHPCFFLAKYPASTPFSLARHALPVALRLQSAAQSFLHSGSSFVSGTDVHYNSLHFTCFLFYKRGIFFIQWEKEHK